MRESRAVAVKMLVLDRTREGEVPPGATDSVVGGAEELLEDGRGGWKVDHLGPGRLVEHSASRSQAICHSQHLWRVSCGGVWPVRTHFWVYLSFCVLTGARRSRCRSCTGRQAGRTLCSTCGGRGRPPRKQAPRAPASNVETDRSQSKTDQNQNNQPSQPQNSGKSHPSAALAEQIQVLLRDKVLHADETVAGVDPLDALELCASQRA